VPVKSASFRTALARLKAPLCGGAFG
jgi:hypothetical protein